MFKFVSKFPRMARLAIGMTTLMALVFSSGAGYKWNFIYTPPNPLDLF